MWIVAIINAVGLISGVFINKTVMYVLFGISFLAFFPTYARVFWKLIYDNHVGNEGREDAALMNGVVCIFVMACVYWLIIQKAGALCVVVSSLQCAVFQIMHLVQQKSERNKVLTIVVVTEFLLSFGYVC